jgi:hypothetical protein
VLRYGVLAVNKRGVGYLLCSLCPLSGTTHSCHTLQRAECMSRLRGCASSRGKHSPKNALSQLPPSACCARFLLLPDSVYIVCIFPYGFCYGPPPPTPALPFRRGSCLCNRPWGTPDVGVRWPVHMLPLPACVHPNTPHSPLPPPPSLAPRCCTHTHLPCSPALCTCTPLGLLPRLPCTSCRTPRTHIPHIRTLTPPLSRVAPRVNRKWGRGVYACLSASCFALLSSSQSDLSPHTLARSPSPCLQVSLR